MFFLRQHGVVVVVVVVVAVVAVVVVVVVAVVVVVVVVVVVISGRRGLTTMFPFHSNCLFLSEHNTIGTSCHKPNPCSILDESIGILVTVYSCQLH